MSGRAELVRELKSLRKGRGLFAGRVLERVGPNLRAVCEVWDGDGPAAVRRKVATRLAELAEHLPADLRLAALAAFAVNDEVRLPRYQDRVLWVAIRLDRDQRTVRRRVDEAIDQLAELAFGAPHGRTGEPAGAWRTTELLVAMALDRERPEVLEQRRIVADQDGLRELDLAVSLPAGRCAMDIGVFYGGTPVDDAMAASNRLGVALALPGPLSKGESHDVAVRFRLPAAHAMRPYLVWVPRRPCELFDLRVRFGRDMVAPRVWTLHGAALRDVSDPVRYGHQYPVDRAGEIHLRFRQLTPGLAYGARWEPGSEVSSHD
ncbi:hypothetical protein [Amycolatopsis cihanbeyliensis]|uniref:Uncharacterized protein n=1 Tax=Amycolatopsis cihanbeyliensis TaxID=1128664 RepID=A0A542DH61_AMYCI|nr:hypothetical protein [Amycolatopsis cihanbeyliensis]TQJ02433.1 hypothetical protein FB471_2162 [Amycolatopsis cihanbeyliensis]